VRHLPVPAGRALIEAPPPRPLQRVQSAAPPATVAAAGGFLAGIATLIVARLATRRRGAHPVGRTLARRGRRGGIEVAGSRSFLVDVHVLRR
jgi:hypothetical protein